MPKDARGDRREVTVKPPEQVLAEKVKWALHKHRFAGSGPALRDVVIRDAFDEVNYQATRTRVDVPVEYASRGVANVWDLKESWGGTTTRNSTVLLNKTGQVIGLDQTYMGPAKSGGESITVRSSLGIMAQALVEPIELTALGQRGLVVPVVEFVQTFFCPPSEAGELLYSRNVSPETQKVMDMARAENRVFKVTTVTASGVDLSNPRKSS